jgi:hypothetical protein
MLLAHPKSLQRLFKAMGAIPQADFFKDQRGKFETGRNIFSQTARLREVEARVCGSTPVPKLLRWVTGRTHVTGRKRFEKNGEEKQKCC